MLSAIKPALFLTIWVLSIQMGAVYAWPWSDSAKYRNECYQACVEDSFGKAKVNEINQRCSNKCNTLPVSPRVQWESYDRCSSNIQDKYDKMVKSESIREGCQLDLARKSKQCDKEEPFFRRFCIDSIKKELPTSCHEAFLDESWYKANGECIEPSVPRPLK